MLKKQTSSYVIVTNKESIKDNALINKRDNLFNFNYNLSTVLFKNCSVDMIPIKTEDKYFFFRLAIIFGTRHVLGNTPV